jgi:hypothetical protein
MISFAGFGSLGSLIPNISKYLRPGGPKAWRLGSYKAGKQRFQTFRASGISSFQAFWPASILIYSFGFLDEHNRDVIPNLVQ